MNQPLAHSAEVDKDGNQIFAQLYADHLDPFRIKSVFDAFLRNNIADTFGEITDFDLQKVAFEQAVFLAFEYHDFGKLDPQCLLSFYLP